MSSDYLESMKKQFEYYKMLGDKTFEQLKSEQLFWQYNEESNSIATIVQHLWGNMLSRWTDFLNSDGEKEWRNRDAEFENKKLTRAELISKWNEGWKCLFEAINPLKEEDLEKLNIYPQSGAYSSGSHEPAACSLCISCRADCFYREDGLRRKMGFTFNSKERFKRIQLREICAAKA